MTRGNWWYVTKTETDPDGTPVRIYHRNGGQFSSAGQKDVAKATKAWTHAIDDTSDCEVCNPDLRPHIQRKPRKRSALEELRALQEAAR